MNGSNQRYIELISQGARVSGTLELRKALVILIEAAVRLTDSLAGSVLLLDSLKKRLFFSVATGPGGSTILNKSISSGEGIAGLGS
jgi:hypothetical protein